jgi:hypothetical protein
VNLLHAGYVFGQQNLIGDAIKIQTDQSTNTLFQNHHIETIFANGVLVCIMQAEPLNPPTLAPVIPFIDFTGNVRIRFLINNNSDFLSRTQVIAAGSNQVYHFSNQANSGTNGFIAQHETGVNNDDLANTSTVEPDEKCFAVIDIHNTGAINSSYDLFGANNRLLSPVYRIRFLPKP